MGEEAARSAGGRSQLMYTLRVQHHGASGQHEQARGHQPSRPGAERAMISAAGPMASGSSQGRFAATTMYQV